MKVLFKNVTRYTKESCDDFIKFHSDKYFKSDFFKFILTIFVVAYVFIYNLIHFNVVLISAILIIILIYVIYEKKELIKSKMFFKNRYKSKNKEQTNEIIRNNTQHSLIVVKNQKTNKIKKARSTEDCYYFYFYDKYMKIKHRKKAKRVKYYKFNKIYETDEYYFIYIDDKEPWMLKKDGFCIGTIEDFSKFIKTKCPFRYKNEK